MSEKYWELRYKLLAAGLDQEACDRAERLFSTARKASIAGLDSFEECSESMLWAVGKARIEDSDSRGYVRASVVLPKVKASTKNTEVELVNKPLLHIKIWDWVDIRFVWNDGWANREALRSHRARPWKNAWFKTFEVRCEFKKASQEVKERFPGAFGKMLEEIPEGKPDLLDKIRSQMIEQSLLPVDKLYGNSGSRLGSSPAEIRVDWGKLVPAFKTGRRENSFFNLDGTWHEVGNLSCCGMPITKPKVCPQIGCYGVIHFQPIYGGYLEVCDNCGRTGEITKSLQCLEEMNEQ